MAILIKNRFDDYYLTPFRPGLEPQTAGLQSVAHGVNLPALVDSGFSCQKYMMSNVFMVENRHETELTPRVSYHQNNTYRC